MSRIGGSPDPTSDHFRLLRERKGLTQESVAARAGISVATLRRFEKGKHVPLLSTVEAIARALEVDVEELLGRAS